MYPCRMQSIVGGYNPDFKIALDWEYWLRLSLMGEGKKINETVGYSRIRRDSQSMKNRSLAENEIQRLKNEYSFYYRKSA